MALFYHGGYYKDLRGKTQCLLSCEATAEPVKRELRTSDDFSGTQLTRSQKMHQERSMAIDLRFS